MSKIISKPYSEHGRDEYDRIFAKSSLNENDSQQALTEKPSNERLAPNQYLDNPSK